MFFTRKISLNLAKKCQIAIIYLTTFTQVCADNIAIVGGTDLTMVSGPPYAAVVTSSSGLSPLDTGTSIGSIYSVSMNSSRNSLVGGQQASGTQPPYAALVSSSGEVTPLLFTGTMATNGFISSVAMNASGNGIIGGKDTSGPVYAALVPPTGSPLKPLTFPDPINNGGIINSVAINDSGNALIGGVTQSMLEPAFAARVSPSGMLTPLALTGGMATSGAVSSISINPSGNGIIGGVDTTVSFSQPIAYVALVSPSGEVTEPLDLGSNMATQGVISSVAINASGSGIVGGQDQTGSQPAYAALVSPSGAVRQLTFTGGMATSGVIYSVAINSSGNGIIGGLDNTGPAYAALVSPSRHLTRLDLGSDMNANGIIYVVAINDAGNGIIGGQNENEMTPAYAALFTSSGAVVPLTFTGGMAVTGWIKAVALPLFYKISTTSLSGNNLIFANYINEFASDDTFYFIPANLDGTLNAALQSAAPTRNGISIYTASNNLFDLTTSFANHIRNQRPEGFSQLKKSATVSENIPPAEELLASRFFEKKVAKNPPLNNSLSIWFDMIGAWAYQKSQRQTVGFHPTTGGIILACDALIMPQLRVGGGVSYLFTHIHENKGQGHSNINQEEAFVYSSWDHQKFYVDMLLMGGGVQINQVRNTTMTGFSFRSSSHPKGWQLLPHLELGFKKDILNSSETSRFDFNPFVMLDWASAWQESYKEKGNSPFNAAQKSYYGSLLRTEAGLRFYETLFFKSWNLTVQEKISYVNTESFNAGKVNAFLVGSPGSFTIETLSSAQNLGVGQLAVSFDPLNTRYPTSTLFYQGEFGPQYKSHQLNIELFWQF